MRDFGQRAIGSLIDAAAWQLAHAARVHDEESVHKMRVSIRRLQQSLRLFAQYVDKAEAKRLRKQLRAFLDAAAEVRNRDIAMMLVTEAGGAPQIIARLERERKTCMRQTIALLRRRAGSTGKWRARLGLS